MFREIIIEIFCTFKSLCRKKLCDTIGLPCVRRASTTSRGVLASFCAKPALLRKASVTAELEIAPVASSARRLSGLFSVRETSASDKRTRGKEITFLGSSEGIAGIAGSTSAMLLSRKS